MNAPTKPKPICPHCSVLFLSHYLLGVHLRDDGDAGGRCPVLAKKKVPA